MDENKVNSKPIDSEDEVVENAEIQENEAEAVETATPSRSKSIKIDSPSIISNETFTIPWIF